MSAMHLPTDVTGMLRDQQLLEQAAREHGIGDPEGPVNANLQSLLSPIIGQLALEVSDSPAPTSRDLYALSRLSLAMALLQREQVRREIADTRPDWPATLTGVATVPSGAYMLATATFSDLPDAVGLGLTAQQAEVEAWKAYVRARDAEQHP